MSLRDRIVAAVALFVPDREACLRQLRELREEALRAGDWADADAAGNTLYQMLRRCPGLEEEALRVARALFDETPRAWTALCLGEAERRRDRRRAAASAYRRAIELARREGDPTLLARGQRSLAELVETKARSGERSDRRPEGEGLSVVGSVADLIERRRVARKGRAWAEEERCLRALVTATRATAAEPKWARALARRFPTGSAFLSLAQAEERAGRPVAARAALLTCLALAWREGNRDLRAEAREARRRLRRGRDA